MAEESNTQSVEKEQPKNDLNYCLLVPERVIGNLIGPKGQTIQNIQGTSGTSVDVAKRHEQSTAQHHEKLVVIKNAPTEKKIEAIELIAKVLAENPEQPGGEFNELVLLIPSTSVPLVVGSKGATIKELSEKSGATINISKSGIPGRVAIKGNFEEIMNAVGGIYEVVETDKRGASSFAPQAQMSVGAPATVGYGYYPNMSGGKGGGDTYGYGGPKMIDWHMVIPATCCSAIIGARGSVVNDIQLRSGCTVDIPKTESHNGDKTITIRANCYQSKSYGLDLILHQLAQCREFNQSGQAPPIRFQIKSEHAGKLVGPGGQIVQRISQQTNSRIDVGRDPFGKEGQYRLVSVSGDVNAIVAAARAIFDVCQ